MALDENFDVESPMHRKAGQTRTANVPSQPSVQTFTPPSGSSPIVKIALAVLTAGAIGGGVAGGVVQIGEDDMGAFPGEGCGAGGADAGSGAGDEGHLVLELSHIVLPLIGRAECLSVAARPNLLRFSGC
jgi:hypothetical protein